MDTSQCIDNPSSCPFVIHRDPFTGIDVCHPGHCALRGNPHPAPILALQRCERWVKTFPNLMPSTSVPNGIRDGSHRQGLVTEAGGRGAVFAKEG